MFVNMDKAYSFTNKAAMILDCSFCDGKCSHLVEENRLFAYHGEEIAIDNHFYKCDKCGEEVTTTELDEINLRQVYRKYWINHVEEGVLFDNVITDLDKPKTMAEYKYILEHYYIYNTDELEIILKTLTYGSEYYPELEEPYKKAFESLKYLK